MSESKKRVAIVCEKGTWAFGRIYGAIEQVLLETGKYDVLYFNWHDSAAIAIFQRTIETFCAVLSSTVLTEFIHVQAVQRGKFILTCHCPKLNDSHFREVVRWPNSTYTAVSEEAQKQVSHALALIRNETQSSEVSLTPFGADTTVFSNPTNSGRALKCIGFIANPNPIKHQERFEELSK